MAVYFGADSISRVQDVWPVFQRRYGILPSIHARYINGPTAAWNCDASEAALCKANGVRLVLVDNSVTVPGGSAGTEADGTAAAQRAVAAVRALGIDSTLIFADIEANQTLSAGFALGWCRGLLGGNVPGGFYGNTGMGSFNVPYAASAILPRIHRLVWTTQPDTGETDPNNPPPFNPVPVPADPSAVVGIQYALGAMGDLIDQSIWTDGAYHLMWPGPDLVRVMVKRSCGLKAIPVHGGPNLAVIPKGGQILDTGQRQGTWALIQWRDLSGWIPATYIVPL